MLPKILVLTDALHAEGAERVLVNIAVTLKRAGRYEPVVCATRRGGTLLPLLEENKVEYFCLNRQKAWEVHKLWRLVSYIRKQNVALIHAHKVGSSFWGGLVGRIAGVPVVAHFHSYLHEGTKAKLAARFSTSLATAVISVSDHVRDLLVSNGVSPNRIDVIYNGVDSNTDTSDDTQSIRSEIGIPLDSTVIAHVAAFRPVKNHTFLMDVAGIVTRRCSNVTFLFVGDGPTRTATETYAKTVGLSDRCIFLGVRKDVPRLLSAADIGVLSSRSEAHPLAVLEYMCASLPMVSTGVGGVPEIVEDGRTGFLVDKDDIEHFASRLIELIEQPDSRKRMGQLGRSVVEEHYSLNSMIRGIEAVYVAVLNR